MKKQNLSSTQMKFCFGFKKKKKNDKKAMYIICENILRDVNMRNMESKNGQTYAFFIKSH